ncbi:MAG: hypothetical protein Q4A00_03880 [Flavobacteriaceae bacterium]|nr:hypothetical protein [Flavobacteriaceae bacterium]
MKKLASCKQGTEKKNDLQEMNLKGKVKSVREIYYDAVEKFWKVEKEMLVNILRQRK